MLFFSVAETIAQQKRLDHFHCNIFGSGSLGGAPLECIDCLALGLFSGDMNLRIGSRQLKSNTRGVPHGIWQAEIAFS